MFVANRQGVSAIPVIVDPCVREHARNCTPAPAQPGDVKVCKECNATKPADFEHFRKAKMGLYGLTANCRECLKLKNRSYRQRSQLVNRAYRGGPASGSGRTKPTTASAIPSAAASAAKPTVPPILKKPALTPSGEPRRH